MQLKEKLLYHKEILYKLIPLIPAGHKWFDKALLSLSTGSPRTESTMSCLLSLSVRPELVEG